MKKVTLAEFAEMMKSDKALQQKMIQASKGIGGGKTQREALKELGSELGYELVLEENTENLEELSDDALKNVAGGYYFPDNELCIFLVKLFGFDETYC